MYVHYGARHVTIISAAAKVNIRNIYEFFALRVGCKTETND